MAEKPKDDLESYEAAEEPRIYSSARSELSAELRPELGPKAKEGRKLPAILTREECKELVAAYKTEKKAARNKLIVRLLYATGMRIEELANIRFCDVFYDNGTIFIQEGKGGKDRYVCADPETFEMLKAWQEEGNKSPYDSVPGVKVRQIRRIVETAGDMAGVSQKYDAMGRVFSAHSFRHAFATHLYDIRDKKAIGTRISIDDGDVHQLHNRAGPKGVREGV